MNSFHLISAILKGKWLVEPNFAISQGTLIASILNKTAEIPEQNNDPLSAFAVSAGNPTATKHSYWNGFDKAPENSIAVISIKGALMKDDQACGSNGTASIGEIIKAADAHHNIDAIVLHIDSPGGTVDGTETLANIVKNTNKPIISFVDGLMASAALWIGSSADEIIASTDTDEIGSVGVLHSFMDIQTYYEKMGAVFHTITASTSPDKTKMWDDLKAGKYKEYIKDVLDPLDEKFMNVIQENLPNTKDEHLTGKVFFARDVMDVFVNSIGTLDFAVQRASELAQNNPAQNPSKNSNTNSMKQLKKLNATLNVDSLESVDQNVSLNEDQLQLVETALEQTDVLTSQLQTANNSLSDAVAEKDTATQSLNDFNASFDAIDETIANAETPEGKATAIRNLLAAKPGAKTEGLNSDKDDTPDANDVAWEKIDALEHNKNVE